jgi:hypothetical protein
LERLVTTAQAAQILGLSLQGVHYRIKNKQLKSIKKSGKTYVYINEPEEEKTTQVSREKEIKIEVTEPSPSYFSNDVIKVKDEQIDLLKTSIKWMKKQYISEISRLEKNQKKIIGVFNREIELLQSAFNEMRSVYKPQIENRINEEKKDKFISVMDFFVYMKARNKSQRDIKLIILKAIQKRDYRFIYNKKEKKLLILNEDFSDLI